MNIYYVECDSSLLRAYVLAEDPTCAYNKFKKHLDTFDIGFATDRVLNKITVIAEEKTSDRQKLLIC